MNEYYNLYNEINFKYENNLLTYEEATYLNDLAYDVIMEAEENGKEKKKKGLFKKKLLKGVAIGGGLAITAGVVKNEYDKSKIEANRKVMSKEDFNDLKKKIKDIDKRNKKANKNADEMASTWLYKQAISEIKSVNKDAESIQKSVNKKYSDDPKRKQILNMVDPIVSKNDAKLKDLQKKSVKKELNRFNNKYWIDYTKKHSDAFKETEKELRGYNTKRGEKHDMDKWIMYHFLPAPVAHALHTQFNRHHKRRAKTEEDYTQMMIDWECNRKTKPDKQMKPYEVLDKFYPDLKETMIPIFRKYGLPINAEEDREMERKKNKKKK